MIIKIHCTEPVGAAILRLFAAMESVRGTAPEDLQFETAPDPVERRSSARTHYVAVLPRNSDGTFDAERVQAIVAGNLASLGKGSIKGIVYQAVVDKTLTGARVIERELRESLRMNAGTSQRELVQLCGMKLVERHAIAEP